MTNEEIQRTMEFIIKQQENFAESMELANDRMNGLERAFVSMFGIVSETVTGLRELAESVKELRAGLSETDDRLNIFITTVERYIRERPSGESSA